MATTKTKTGGEYRARVAISYPATDAIAARIREAIALTGRAVRDPHEMRHAAAGEVASDIPAACVAGLLVSGAIEPVGGETVTASTASAAVVTVAVPIAPAYDDDMTLPFADYPADDDEEGEGDDG